MASRLLDVSSNQSRGSLGLSKLPTIANGAKAVVQVRILPVHFLTNEATNNGQRN